MRAIRPRIEVHNLNLTRAVEAVGVTFTAQVTVPIMVRLGFSERIIAGVAAQRLFFGFVEVGGESVHGFLFFSFGFNCVDKRVRF